MTTETITGDRFARALQDAINHYIEGEVKKAIEEVKARLDKDRPRIMAEIAVAVQNALSPHDIDSILQIRLRPLIR